MAIAKNAMGGSSGKKPRNQARTQKSISKKSLRLEPSAVKKYNKEVKAEIKAGKPGVGSDRVSRKQLVDKVSSSGYKVGSRKSLTARKVSVPNKVKAQGAKTMSQGMKYSAGRKGK